LKKREYKNISKSKNEINKVQNIEEFTRFSEIEDNEMPVNESINFE